MSVEAVLSQQTVLFSSSPHPKANSANGKANSQQYKLSSKTHPILPIIWNKSVISAYIYKNVQPNEHLKIDIRNLKTLSYKADGLLPGIYLDKENGQFMIFGQSCPENVMHFYDPVFNWLDSYCEKPLKKTVFDFRLTYFNTASAKIFLMIMIRMEELSEAGHDVKVRWYYNDGDEDMYEAGEEFESIVGIQFELIPVNSN